MCPTGGQFFPSLQVVLLTETKHLNFPQGNIDLNKFYCQIYTIRLNTSFTTCMKFSPVPYKRRSDREHDG
jgi:hypothetical protein